VNNLLALLDKVVQKVVAYAITSEATDSERHICAGRLSAIQDLHSELVQLFKEAQSALGVDACCRE